MKKLLLIPLALLSAGLLAADQTTISPYPKVRLKTSLGTLLLELDGYRSPITTVNFVQYVREGYYDGTIFHRVIDGFMAQAGAVMADYEEKETRAPIPNESGNGLKNRRGTIAMARTSNPHSATAQFYINLADNAKLDPSASGWGYTVFGVVAEGMDVVDKIAAIPTGPAGPFRSDAPQSTILIESAELITE